MHYVNTDKRLDEWVPEDTCRKVPAERTIGESSGTKKRKRRAVTAAETPHVSQPASPTLATSRVESPVPSETNGSVVPYEIVMTEEDFDIQHHKQITAQRNFDKVHFGEWQVKTW